MIKDEEFNMLDSYIKTETEYASNNYWKAKAYVNCTKDNLTVELEDYLIAIKTDKSIFGILLPKNVELDSLYCHLENGILTILARVKNLRRKLDVN